MKIKQIISGCILILASAMLFPRGGYAAPGVDWFNVKDYGAVGNGTTDDTASIQNAMNAAKAAAKGHGGVGPSVFFPKGTYKITSTLTWPTHVSIIGSTLGASVIDWAGPTTGTAITTASLIFKKMQDMHFRNGTPAVWIINTGATDWGGQLIRCKFNATSGSGAAAVVMNAGTTNGHWTDLEFFRPQPYAIRINAPSGSAQLSFKIDGFFVDFSGHSAARGFLQWNGNTNATTTIKLANGRLFSTTALLSPGTVLNVTGAYGIAPCYINLENLTTDAAGLNSLVNQDASGGGSATARSTVAIVNVKANGVPNVLSGSWAANAILPMPSGGQIMYLAAGDGNRHGQFQRLAVGPSAGAACVQHFSTTATWNPPAAAIGGQVNTTLTVAGAAPGDILRPSFSVAVPAGAILTGSVTAANTVAVTLLNQTGGVLDLPNGTLRVDVWRMR